MNMSARPTTRIIALDAARGFALVAMAVYHFGWDLSFFGYVDSASVNDGPWKIFARCIASSFLFLVGIGLVLAHQNGVRWRGFWRRWLKIAAAALIITVATYFFTPDAFIFFGILHQIAFASLAGLIFLRLPALLLIALGIAWVLLAPMLKSEAFDSLYLAWTGLQAQGVRSNDYVPVFPWFGAVLMGMGFGKRANLAGWFEQLRGITHGKSTGILAFLGRHSLIVYLVHQPLLIGLIYVFSMIAPAQVDELALQAQFETSCEQSCGLEHNATRCVYFCGCVAARLQAEALFTPVMTGKLDFASGQPAEISRLCSIEMLEIPNQ